MSSCFVPTPIKIRGFAGKKYTDHTLMQFVPGIVKHVVTAKSSLRATTNNAERNINSIIAKPHVFEGNMPRDEDLYHEKFRYFPLLRGMVDVPTKGDPVLLCTFGGINYYLGPLNTENNPNYNKDNLDKPDPLPGKVTQAISGKVTDATESKNKPKNFKFKPFPRMEKKVNHSLDTPIGGTGRDNKLWYFKKPFWFFTYR